MAELGARKNGGFKAVSTAPSINKTPVGNSTPPLPYPMTQDLSNSVSVVPTVRFNSDPAYVLNQTTQPSSKGDAPGTAKGVKSGTVSGEVKPVKGSGTVRLDGKPAIRVNDPCTLNGGNCPGVYVAAPAPSSASPSDAGKTQPGASATTPAEAGFLARAAGGLKQGAEFYKSQVSPALHDFAGRAMDQGGNIAAAGGGMAAVGGGMVATGIGAAPGAVLAAAGGATGAVGGGVGAVGAIAGSAAAGLDAMAEYALSGKLPNAAAVATALAQRIVMSKVDKITGIIPGRKGAAGQGGGKPATPPPKPGDHKAISGGSGDGGPGDGLKVLGSVGGDCGVKPYKDQKCPPGQQAHHIVPDYTLRYGSRSEGIKGENRIPGMPSFEDGPSICLSGHSKLPQGEHNAAHRTTDKRISAIGEGSESGPNGAARIGDIVEISIDEVSKIRPHCKQEIETKTKEAFKGVDPSKYARTTQRPPAPDTEASKALQRGDVHGSTPNRRRK